MRFVFFFVLLGPCFVFGGKRVKVYYNITDHEYDQMPTLFELDNFDVCMNFKNTLYCYATIQLGPADEKKPSKVWNIIKEVISVARSYRHDKLRHGICVPKSCPKISTAYYATGNGSDALWKGISECYTQKYTQTSGLKGAVTKLHCESNEPFYKIDFVDILYAICIGTLLLVVVVATIYENCHKNGYPDSLARPANELKLEKLLTIFSITHNWKRLLSESKSPDATALQVIQGIRVYNMFFVVLSHTVMILMMGPIFNTRYVEDTTLRTENMFLSNGGLIIQTFLLVSGWFLSYNLCVIFEGKRVRMGHLIAALVNRMMRVVPLLLVGVGFSATWLRHMDRGPVWNSFVGDEFRNCRKNWLANVLFVSNYYRPNEMCLQQTWSMSVDTQCFIIGLIIMMLVLNNPQHANKIFGFFITLGILIGFVHNYYIDTDIVYRSYPENLYTMYLEDKQWLSTFISSDVSFPCYVQGLMFGYYFYNFKRSGRKFITNKFWLLVWYVFIWIVPIATILIAGHFYKDGAEYSRTQAILYQSLNRYVFGLPIGTAIFGMTMGVGGMMILAVTWAPLQTIARLSFSIYIVHVWPMRINYGATRSPFYLTNSNLIRNSISDFTYSLLLGTVLCLLIEMPMSGFLKILTSPDETTIKETKKSQ